MAETNHRQAGVVIKFTKSYGFIKPDDGSGDIFVHQSEIRSANDDDYRTLREGQQVEFSAILSGDRSKAVDVTGPNGTLLGRIRGGGNGGYGTRNGSSGGKCFTCGGVGHRAADCATVNNGECYTCHQFGHLARECPQRSRPVGGAASNGVGCFTCGDLSHRKRECPLATDVGAVAVRSNNGGGVECYNCHDFGHFSSNCPNVGGAVRSSRNGVCYTCGKSGHLKKDCPADVGQRVGGGECYNCNEVGHLKRDCPNGIKSSGGRGGGFSRGGGECYNCGESGHFSRECPNPKNV